MNSSHQNGKKHKENQKRLLYLFPSAPFKNLCRHSLLPRTFCKTLPLSIVIYASPFSILPVFKRTPKKL